MYTIPLLIPLLHNWTSDLYLMQNKLDLRVSPSGSQIEVSVWLPKDQGRWSSC